MINLSSGSRDFVININIMNRIIKIKEFIKRDRNPVNEIRDFKNKAITTDIKAEKNILM